MSKSVPRQEQPAVAKIICRLVAKWRMHPYEINNGCCEEFAGELADLLGGDQGSEQGPALLFGDQHLKYFTPAHDAGGHCYVYYYGRYYDAEEPNGVKYPYMLPFYMRHILQREDLARVAHAAVTRKYAKAGPIEP